jgi:hypothetical protein
VELSDDKPGIHGSQQLNATQQHTCWLPRSVVLAESLQLTRDELNMSGEKQQETALLAALPSGLLVSLHFFYNRYNCIHKVVCYMYTVIPYNFFLSISLLIFLYLHHVFILFSYPLSIFSSYLSFLNPNPSNNTPAGYLGQLYWPNPYN